jgi:DNA-binding CsgD family transcriptional regulator
MIEEDQNITTKEIAAKLQVSQRTADTYRQQTRDKLGKKRYAKITLQQIKTFLDESSFG